MSDPDGSRVRQFYAQTYDATVADWPGEIDFYRELAAKVRAQGGQVLELACGTGRVAIRLAQDGTDVVGLDRSAPMLEVAREKSLSLRLAKPARPGGARWVQADMRAFALGETFALAIIPGHAFQNLVTADDQAACLECTRRHLSPSGRLVVHLDRPDVSWLGEIAGEKGGVLKPAGEFVHPKTGRPIRTLSAWSYEAATQTAILQTVWEELGGDGQVTERWDSGPVRLHCVFPFEMEHLLARAGFLVEAVYGDFGRNELRDDSSEMIWLARADPKASVQPDRAFVEPPAANHRDAGRD